MYENSHAETIVGKWLARNIKSPAHVQKIPICKCPGECPLKNTEHLWARHYVLAPLENHVAMYPSIFARKCRIKLANILNLAKWIVRQNRPVSVRII